MVNQSLKNKKIIISDDNIFINKGFTLVYNIDLYEQKIISEKLDNRSLTIFLGIVVLALVMGWVGG